MSLEGMTAVQKSRKSGVTPRDSDDRAGESVAKLRGWRGARDSDRKKTHAAKPVERPVDSTTGSFAVRGAVRRGARRVRHATLQGFDHYKKVGSSAACLDKKRGMGRSEDVESGPLHFACGLLADQLPIRQERNNNLEKSQFSAIFHVTRIARNSGRSENLNVFPKSRTRRRVPRAATLRLPPTLHRASVRARTPDRQALGALAGHFLARVLVHGHGVRLPARGRPGLARKRPPRRVHAVQRLR